MKLLIVLSLIACGYAAKLDRTYLPPASAATAGGSPGSLNTPVGASGSGGFGQPSASSGFGQPATSSGFGQPAANTGFGQPATFGPSKGAVGKSISGPAFGSQPGTPSGQYGQPGAPSGGFDAGFGAVAQNFGPQDYQRNQPQRAQAAAEQSAEILRSDNQNDGETFSYSFETSNGIAAEESGVATNGVQAQGAFSYSDDEGQNFRVTYTADENGYQPQGDHLPTPHPIPEDFLKSIEKNAQAAAAGTQQGAYNPDEDNSVNAPQQYNYNAPTSYGQGPSGSGSNQQGSGPSQLYGTPNAGGAGSRPQSSRSFQPQGPAQNYGAPNSGSARPTDAGQSQAPSQNYGAPTNSAALGTNAGPQAGSFGENQAPSQQYGAPRPGTNGGSNNFMPLSPASNGFAPSGPAPQSRPNQYQASQSGFPSAGRPQGRAQGQAQDESGYQYDRPQGSFGQASSGTPSNQGATGQYRPQANEGSQPAGPRGSFSRANSGSAGYPSGPAQGSFAPSSGPSSQGSFGPSSGFNAGSFGPSSGPKGPSSFAPSTGSAGQGYPAPGQGPSSFSPSGSNGQSAFRPTSGGNGFGRSQGSFPAAGAKGAMADSGYTYDRPGSQNGAGSQAGAGTQPRFGANAGSRPGQNFGGPRQPPSFSEEEGYKY